ncbi:MAG: DNA polymerase IV [Bacteroidota bacterium]
MYPEPEKNIVHFDLDSFFVSVERLQNSSLNGKPVIIGGMSDRGVVASCSYEARKFGISSAMPMKLARRLCSDAVFIRGDMEQYSKYSMLVTQIIEEKAPVFEKTSIDEFYIDVTGMDRFFGCLKWTRELRSYIISNTGLPISFGLSVNKTVSKMATNEAKPNGEKEVPYSAVQPFLFPLSIKKIPMIGDKTFRLLRSMGISTIRTLSEMPVEMLQSVLGVNGIILWKKANGIDPTPVRPYHESKSISTERTFQEDTIDVAMLNSILAGMVEKIAWQLRKKGKLASCVTVKIRYSNFDTYTQQKHIAYTNLDHLLLDTAKELFGRLYNRRLMVRLIGVRFSGLVYGGHQMNLFEDTPEMISLYMAMDHIRKKYGSKAIQRAIGMRQ